MIYAKDHAEFVTITCLEWHHILREDRLKDIIISSLDFLSKADRIRVYGFVIMSNHFHLIWQMVGDNKRADVQRDFLKYTTQQILKHLCNERSEILKEIEVDAKDRKYQVWERNSLGVPLWSQDVFHQKLEYMHYNPVKAGLCDCSENYRYSSARFYEKNVKDWDFLVHYEG